MAKRKKNTKQKPGIDREPSAAELGGVDSLMPPTEKKPSKAAKLVKLPFKVVAIPFKVARSVLRVPFRIFGRRSEDETKAS